MSVWKTVAWICEKCHALNYDEYCPRCSCDKFGRFGIPENAYTQLFPTKPSPIEERALHVVDGLLWLWHLNPSRLDSYSCIDNALLFVAALHSKYPDLPISATVDKIIHQRGYT